MQDKDILWVGGARVQVVFTFSEIRMINAMLEDWRSVQCSKLCTKEAEITDTFETLVQTIKEKAE